MVPLSTQLYSFGIILLAGVSLGLFFDLFRVIRGILRPGTISTPLLDLLFWALVTPVLILYILLANWGELRGYVLIGLALGFFFYKLLLSGIVLSFMIWLSNLIMTVLNATVTLILRLISAPLVIATNLRLNKPSGMSNPFRFRPRLRWKR